jgi:hypothetical protein
MPMSRRDFPGRDEQRQMILRSEAYLSGESFTRIDAAKLLGLSPESGSHLLSSMASEGLLAKRLVHRQGSKASGTIHYSKPPSRLARVAWRTTSNEALGITA